MDIRNKVEWNEICGVLCGVYVWSAPEGEAVGVGLAAPQLDAHGHVLEQPEHVSPVYRLHLGHSTPTCTKAKHRAAPGLTPPTLTKASLLVTSPFCHTGPSRPQYSTSFSLFSRYTGPCQGLL